MIPSILWATDENLYLSKLTKQMKRELVRLNLLLLLKALLVSMAKKVHWSYHKFLRANRDLLKEKVLESMENSYIQIRKTCQIWFLSQIISQLARSILFQIQVKAKMLKGKQQDLSSSQPKPILFNSNLYHRKTSQVCQNALKISFSQFKTCSK